MAISPMIAASVASLPIAPDPALVPAPGAEPTHQPSEYCDQRDANHKGDACISLQRGADPTPGRPRRCASNVRSNHEYLGDRGGERDRESRSDRTLDERVVPRRSPHKSRNRDHSAYGHDCEIRGVAK